MTNLQKKNIINMREKGSSYSQIADALSISINSVKSFCKRNLLGGIRSGEATVKLTTSRYCRHCGKVLTQITGKRAKKYCSDVCRMAWWNMHPEDMTHSSTRTYACQTCGSTFTGYVKRNRKYCSRSCYGKSKAVKS